MTTELWTIGQLTEQVAASLRVRRDQPAAEESATPSARTDPGGQLNGRIREVPDTRTIRWYQTTGIVDRPTAMRGRTALYGRRHLLQLLAIKRLQALGHTLAGIQAELAGVSDASLVRLAGLAGESVPVDGGSPASAVRSADGGVRNRFWAAAPTTAAPDRAAESATESGQPRPAALTAAAHSSQHGDADLIGMRIDAELTLLFDRPGRPLTADDVAAIRDAAQPLVQLVHQRGLLGADHEADHESERGKDNL